jgi:hypothetical protein
MRKFLEGQIIGCTKEKLKMARIPRILITGEPTAYHVISRTALVGYPIGGAEKDYFVDLIGRNLFS